jgi:hypothetical protein
MCYSSIPEKQQLPNFYACDPKSSKWYVTRDPTVEAAASTVTPRILLCFQYSRIDSRLIITAKCNEHWK